MKAESSCASSMLGVMNTRHCPKKVNMVSDRKSAGEGVVVGARPSEWVADGIPPQCHAWVARSAIE